MFKPKNKSHKTQKEQHWHQIINEWLSSGKTILTYCEEKKIGIASFYQWRNRLMPDYPKRSKSMVRGKKSSRNNKLFIPIQVNNANIKPPIANEGLILHYPNGCHLHLKGHFDPAILKQLNQAMGI